METLMRLSRLFFFLLLAISAIGLASPVAAQPSLRVGGGISSPNGDMGDLLGSGYHGRVMLSLGVPVAPVSLRFEGAMHRFNASGTDVGKMNQLNGTIGAELTLGLAGIEPYLFVGWGKYRQEYSSEFELGESQTHPGYHAGFGVQAGILGLGGFVEVRIVQVSGDISDSRYVPLTVGLSF